MGSSSSSPPSSPSPPLSPVTIPSSEKIEEATAPLTEGEVEAIHESPPFLTDSGEPLETEQENISKESKSPDNTSKSLSETTFPSRIAIQVTMENLSSATKSISIERKSPPKTTADNQKSPPQTEAVEEPVSHSETEADNEPESTLGTTAGERVLPPKTKAMYEELLSDSELYEGTTKGPSNVVGQLDETVKLRLTPKLQLLLKAQS
ncbi:hypothetical protein R6Q59_018910 [Mikania micrantha]